MNRIIFARTRYHYNDRGEECCRRQGHSRSYEDFWKLVELSEMEVCYVDEIDLAEKVVYIVTPRNGELEPALEKQRELWGKEAPGKVVWWNLERPDTIPGRDFNAVVEESLRWVDEIWVSDKAFYRLFPDRPEVRHVILGSDSRLAGAVSDTTRKDFDVIYLAFYNTRRRSIMSDIARAVKIRPGPNCWGPTRHRVLLQSRFMVQIHQVSEPYGALLRIALAAAYRMPLLSETVEDPYPLVVGDHFAMENVGRLPELVRQALQDPYDKWKEMGNRLHDLMCVQHRFADEVRGAVGVGA